MTNKASPENWKSSLIGALSCVFANGLGMGLSLPLLSLLLERNGVSASVNGLNTTFGAVAMILVTPFIPALAARLGTLPFLASCYLTAALSLILFRAVESIWMWFVLRFTLNCALQGLFVASEVWINQLATDRNRGRIIALYSAVFSSGFALGPIMIQGLGTQGWLPFIAGALTMSAALVPLLIAGGRRIPAIEHAPFRATFRYFFASPSAATAALTYGALEASALTFLAIYAIRLGSPETTATLLIAAWGLGNMLLVPGVGWLADKFDRRYVLLLCGVMCSLAALSLPWVDVAGITVLVLIFIWGGFAAAIYVLGLTHVGSIFKGSALAPANGAFAMLYAVGTMLGPSAGGTAIDLWNPYGLTLILALFPAILALVVGYRAATIARPRA